LDLPKIKLYSYGELFTDRKELSKPNKKLSEGGFGVSW
jgi:hypothetical protein